MAKTSRKAAHKQETTEGIREVLQVLKERQYAPAPVSFPSQVRSMSVDQFNQMCVDQRDRHLQQTRQMLGGQTRGHASGGGGSFRLSVSDSE